MPINPNIALGVQPQPQPVNMLGQLGQLYALKAAKQDIEGGEAVRGFFAGGGDLSTPEGQRQIMTAAPKLGGQLIKQQADIRKVQIDTLKDEIGLRRDALSNVRTPEDYLAWHDANHTGQLGAFFKSAGINPSRESIMAELAKPGGLDRLVRGSALGATKLQQELMQTERSYGAAAISAAPGHRQADLAVQKYKDEIANPKLERVEGDNGFYLYDPRKPNSAVPLGMAPVAEPAPVATPAAPANSLVTTQAAPTINLNALTGGAPNQQGAPTVANAAAADAAARAAAAQPSPLRPKGTAPTLTRVEDPANKGQMLEVDARTYRGGTIGDPGVIGVARTEKLTPAQTVKLKAEMGNDFIILDNVTAQTSDLLKSIDMLRDPKISKGLEAITGYSGVLTPTFKDASQLAQTRLDNLRGKVIALGKASAAMTGAIGSIANQEWKILADQIAAIDPKMGNKALLEQVQLVEDRALGVFERAKEQYGRQYGEYFETLGPQYSTMPKLKPRGVSSSGVDSNNPFLREN